MNKRQTSELKSLMKLPAELLQMIIEYLSPADLACLALCNHTLLSRLGTGSLMLPHEDNEKHRELFLTRLAQDLPPYFLCYPCSRLHLSKYVDPPGPAFQPRRRLRCHYIDPGESLWESVKAHKRSSLYRFRFVHLQLAMKRHYHGCQHGISTESLAFSEVRSSCDGDELTTLLSVDARVCPQDRQASLCLRVQHWAMLDDSMDQKLLLSKMQFMLICDHLEVDDPKIIQIINESRPSQLELFTCRSCNVDFQLEIRECGDRALALVITKWLDLGSGLTPKDPRWRAHLGWDEGAEIDAFRRPGEIRRRFEKEHELSQDALSRLNESYLVARNFKTRMVCWPKNKTWIGQGGKKRLVPAPGESDLFFSKMGRLLYLGLLCANVAAIMLQQAMFLYDMYVSGQADTRAESKRLPSI
jgi:hypothetical protein